MRAEYPDYHEGPRGSYLDIIFAMIVVMASGFSAYTTYLGFSRDLPVYMAITIAGIIGMGLLGMNFKIRSARRSEGGRPGPYVIFALIFVFSFLSNTNAFYSLFVEQDIVRETQTEAYEVFDHETSRALTLIEKDPGYQRQLRQFAEIENEITKLREQITDPRNPGMGEKAKEHLERIEGMLETETTSLAAPARTAPLAEHQRYADQIESHIRTLMAERSSRGIAEEMSMSWETVAGFREKHRGRIQQQDFQRRHTDEMKRDLDAVENLVNRVVEPKPPLELADINDQADEVGKFKYTWRNFAAWVSPVAIVLAIVLGALLDIIGPAMSIGLYRPQYD